MRALRLHMCYNLFKSEKYTLPGGREKEEKRMYYLIGEKLEACCREDLAGSGKKYVAVLTPEQWQESAECFDMGIDLPMDLERITETKIEVNFDSLTGTFHIPNKGKKGGKFDCFGFAMDEKGIVFIDKGKGAEKYIDRIINSRKWRIPSLERFLYDFLECIVEEDSGMLAGLEMQLGAVEEDICSADGENTSMVRINEARRKLLFLRQHYEQLIDFSQELEENENNFFAEENLRYFHMFTVRVERLRDTLSSLRDYSVQLRELYQTQLDVKQNKIMAVLTIVTTIFMPLTLITGWYGMNFVHMPELQWRYAYPALILICIGIVALEIHWFRKNTKLKDSRSIPDEPEKNKKNRGQD